MRIARPERKSFAGCFCLIGESRWSVVPCLKGNVEHTHLMFFLLFQKYSANGFRGNMLMLRVAAREHGTQSRERCAQAPLNPRTIQ